MKSPCKFESQTQQEFWAEIDAHEKNIRALSVEIQLKLEGSLPRDDDTEEVKAARAELLWYARQFEVQLATIERWRAVRDGDAVAMN